MVNQMNHCIISALNSRKVTDIQKWLQQYPNLKVVSRDGSNIYRLAIELANPDIIQVSDRFHLIKGLSESIRKDLKNILPKQIIIDEIKVDIPKKSLKERYQQTKLDISRGEKISIACKNNIIDTRTFKKLVSFNDKQLHDYFDDKYTQKRQVNVDRKNKEVELVKRLYNKGMSYVAISRQIGIDRRTVKKYVNIEKKLTIKDTTRERANLCLPFHNKISKLVLENIKTKTIYIEIQKLGYQGKYGTLRQYISKLKKEEKLIYKRVLSRNKLLRLLYTSRENIKELNRNILMKIFKIYPTSKKLIELMLEFKNILLASKSEKCLLAWFRKAEKLNMTNINSFVKGCYNDMQAIINSIKYTYSNGVTEASVNKIKLVKRIMHGRCSFELLKSKTLQLEILRQIN